MGAKLHYKPVSPDDIKKLDKYGLKVLDRLFIGYEQHHGGKWTSNLMVVNCGELESDNTASSVNAKRIPADNVHIQLNAKRGLHSH